MNILWSNALYIKYILRLPNYIHNLYRLFYLYSTIVMLLSLLLAWQNYWMLIGWEEDNYFINCTAVQLMIFQKQTKWRKGILNTNVKWNCLWGTRWKYEQKH
jgi:hypothetical protein